jgi:hypothetical protein
MDSQCCRATAPVETACSVGGAYFRIGRASPVASGRIEAICDTPLSAAPACASGLPEVRGEVFVATRRAAAIWPRWLHGPGRLDVEADLDLDLAKQ